MDIQEKEFKKQAIFDYLQTRSKGLIRLNDIDLENIISIVETSEEIISVIFSKAHYSQNGGTRWEKIRTFLISQSDLEKGLSKLEKSIVAFGEYKYEFLDRHVITNNNCLFD